MLRCRAGILRWTSGSVRLPPDPRPDDKQDEDRDDHVEDDQVDERPFGQPTNGGGKHDREDAPTGRAGTGR